MTAEVSNDTIEYLYARVKHETTARQVNPSDAPLKSPKKMKLRVKVVFMAKCNCDDEECGRPECALNRLLTHSGTQKLSRALETKPVSRRTNTQV